MDTAAEKRGGVVDGAEEWCCELVGGVWKALADDRARRWRFGRLRLAAAVVVHEPH